MNRPFVMAILAVAGVALIVGAAAGQTLSQTKTITTTQTTTPPSGRLYELVFNQTGNCPPPPETYVAPWAVTINNKTTIVGPPGWSFPLPSTVEFRPSFRNSSIIVFSVPDGNYSYVVYPQTVFAQSGTVLVSGSNLVVQVEIKGMVAPCLAH